ncbi:MAG: UvrD-helicase domain-containing protein [Nitrospirae bacterium]|nr:UvrD-helicase domain-containing protein [Nitrospirota bacterium]
MNNLDFLKDLNPQQLEAVRHQEGPLLILAGAGSGKTKVITSRFSYFVKALGISPANILCVTFTNKAAEEMKIRVREMTGFADPPWVHTFHSAAVKILRSEIDLFGIPRNFMIYDKGDQLALLRECVRELNFNEELYPVKTIAARISELKNLLMTPEQFSEKAQSFGLQEKIARVYPLYRDKLRKQKALDFDDLLMVLIQIFKKHPEVLKRYQNQFSYMMVDEYQDTNFAQYQLISLLCKEHRNICCVGDDDQSIYGFRGADIKNILRFENDYHDTRVIKLEQNYRSTKTILNAANKVIERNDQRKGKQLWTNNQRGEAIEVYRVESDEGEADLISQMILAGAENKSEASFQRFAILYRTHIQSRALEESFQKRGVPYVIVGGTRFFERKEIKDILAYLRVIVDPVDEVNLKRIINVPVRGIGAQTIEKAVQFSEKNGCKLFDGLEKIQGTGLLGVSAEKAVRSFTTLINEMAQKAVSTSILDLVQLILSRTHYIEEIKKEKAAEKIENIYEFFSSVTEFQEKNNSSDLPSFLDHVALFSDVADEKTRGRVRLMTLHSAKGLEFPVVFMPGMEEGLFPHSRALVDHHEMEEERRLCYVGMTRAREKLILTSAKNRRMYGSVQFNSPSRFIEDIPVEFVQKKELNREKPPKTPVYREKIIEKRFQRGYLPGEQGEREGEAPEKPYVRCGTSPKASSEGGGDASPHHRRVNQSVVHPLWGRGVILSSDGEGDDLRMTIRFESSGTKKMALKYANLKFL